MPVVAVADPSHVPPGTPAGSGLLDVIDAVRAAGHASDVVLLASDLAGLRQAWSTRLAIGEDRIGIVYKDLPPTAFYAVVAACNQLPEQALGLASVTVAATVNAIHTRTLLSSVTAVERPAPSLGQHLSSLLPGTRFVVDHSAETVTRARTLPTPSGVTVIIGGSTKQITGVDTSDWPHDRVALPAMESSSRWAASRWLEATTLSHPIEAILGGVLHPQQLSQYMMCSTCGRPGWGARCIFCELPFSPSAVQLVPGLPNGGLK